MAPPADPFLAPVRELTYVLRAYGKDGKFDETEPQLLWLFHAERAPGRGVAAPVPAPPARGAQPTDGSPGTGERPAIRSSSWQRRHREGRRQWIPPQHTAGVPASRCRRRERQFRGRGDPASGMHTVEVAAEAGNGELFLRDLEFERSDWFYVAMADLTLAANDTDGPADELEGEDAPRDYDSSADGRLAFYVNGKFRKDWKLTASADTREGPVSELFSNFVDKQPESLLRRLDPDYYYPTFGDDSVVEETAPTLGKFFVKLNKAESHAMWGNFEVEYLENELAQVERGLYGGNLRYQSPSTTKFGEQRLVIDGFAAEPGTVPSREEFRGTGGSLYFLRHQDLLVGSDLVRIEVRDKDSGLVTGVKYLRPVLDYDIDYIQGRVLLSEPLSPTVDGSLLVRTGGLSGDEAYLVVQYEFTPGLEDLDAMAAGGQGEYWFNDFVKLGLIANTNDDGDDDINVHGTD
jgi:hypothetical protein